MIPAQALHRLAKNQVEFFRKTAEEEGISFLTILTELEGQLAEQDVATLLRVAAGEGLEVVVPNVPWVEKPWVPTTYPTIQPNIYTPSIPKQSPFGGPEVTC